MTQQKSPAKKSVNQQAIREERKQKIVLGVVIAIAIYIILAIAPFTGPYFQYPVHVVRCMRLPVVASDYGRNYDVPGQRFYSVDPLVNHFFCSEKEAQDAGFRKNPLNN